MPMAFVGQKQFGLEGVFSREVRGEPAVHPSLPKRHAVGIVDPCGSNFDVLARCKAEEPCGLRSHKPNRKHAESEARRRSRDRAYQQRRPFLGPNDGVLFPSVAVCSHHAARQDSGSVGRTSRSRWGRRVQDRSTTEKRSKSQPISSPPERDGRLVRLSNPRKPQHQHACRPRKAYPFRLRGPSIHPVNAGLSRSPTQQSHPLSGSTSVAHGGSGVCSVTGRDLQRLNQGRPHCALRDRDGVLNRGKPGYVNALKRL